MQNQEVIIRNPMALNEDALAECLSEDVEIASMSPLRVGLMERRTVTVNVGDSPKLGLQLIMTLLVHNPVQAALAALNVRCDREVMESLAHIVNQFEPKVKNEVQIVSCPSPLVNDAYPFLQQTAENGTSRISATHLRAAFQSAVGNGLKFPSVDFEEYVANYLGKVK